MSIKTKTITNVLAWDLVAMLFLRGLPFVTSPIFTRLMQPSDYGQIETFGSWVAVLSTIIGLGTDGAIALAKIEFDDKEFNRYNSSVLFLNFIVFSICFLLAIPFYRVLSELLGFPKPFIPLIIATAFFSYCTGYSSNRLVQLKKTNINSLINVFQSVISVIVAIIILRKIQTEKYIAKICIDSSFTVIIGIFWIIYLFLKGKTLINKKYWSFCLAISLPLIFHSFASIIFNQSDRVMLKAMVSEAETGIYSIAYNGSMIISVIWMSCNRVWIPYYYEYKKDNNVKLIKEKSNNYMLFFTTIALGFICVAPEVFKLLAPASYMGGLKVIPLIAGAYFFNFMYSFPANYEFYNKKTKVIAIGTCFTTVVNIILNYLLIPRFLSLGAAFATLLSYICLFLFHEFNVRFIIKAKDFDYSFLFYLKGIIPIFIAIIAYYFLLDFWYVRWIIGTILGVFLLIRIIKQRAIF